MLYYLFLALSFYIDAGTSIPLPIVADGITAAYQ
jgi:hypothetical protein